MSSKARYLYGDTAPVSVIADADYPIEVGDLLFKHTDGKARPASAMVDQGTLALNQDAFQQYFLGVSMQKNGLQSGETAPMFNQAEHSPANVIQVATAGVFLFDCASHTFVTGELVGACEKSSGTALENQKVAPLAAGSESKSIGQAVPTANQLGNATTQVAVRIQSTIVGGGVQSQIAGSSSGAI